MAKPDANAIECKLQQIGEVLLEDSLKRIWQAKQWPLVVDNNGNVGTFLRYRNTIYLYADNPRDMESESLRKTILGAVRYGKPLIIDMDEKDSFETLSAILERIHSNLVEMLMSKSLVNDKLYLQLIKDSDGDEYKPEKFLPDFISKFMFILLIKGSHASAKLLQQTLPIYVS